MSATPLVTRREGNNRRADQRVPEHQSRIRLVDLDDACSFGRGKVVEARVSRGRCLQYPQVAGTVQDGDQQQCDGRRGQLRNPGREQSLQARRQRQGAGQMRSRGPGISKSDGQLEQRERVALRIGDQPLAHGRRQRGEPLLEQGRRGRSVQRLDLVTGQSSTIEEALGLGPQSRQESDTGASEATHGRSKDQRTRPVQPLQIIDYHEQGPSCRGVAEKSQNRVRDHQPARRRPGVQPKRDAQRLAMQGRQHRQVVQERMQDNAEPREAKLCLELCAGRPDHPRSSRLCVEYGDIQQRRLADTSVAGHQQRPAPDSRVIHEAADEPDVQVPPDELHGRITTHGPSLHPGPRWPRERRPGLRRPENLADLARPGQRRRFRC